MIPSPKRPTMLCLFAALILLLTTSGVALAEPAEGETQPEAAPEADAPDASSTPAVSAPPEEGDAAAAEASAAADEAADSSDEASAESEEDRRISEKVADAVAAQIDENFPVKVSYGSKGFRLETRDGNWQTNLQWRAQFRLTYPYVGDPRQVDDFGTDDKTTFEARRLRMKIGGHGYRPWLKYYFELDLEPSRDVDDSAANSSVRVIDWRADLAKWEKLGLRVGQWKIDYNRERVDSSGRQAFVERSIVNRVFTIDRQMGMQLRGRLFKGTPADFRYYAGLFTGEGRGTLNDDNKLLYAGRLQWNMLGRDVALRQTDVERTEKLSIALGVGAAYNIGRCTRWSSSGCGNLDGFDDEADAEEGQFKIQQMAQDFALKWQGWSIQQEFHWKRIHDRGPGTRGTFDLFGANAQTGYFFGECIDWFPDPLEFGVRWAWVKEPNETDRTIENIRSEYTAAANWFFAGHNNKLTLDYSYLTLEDGLTGQEPSDHRVRLQWDVSF